MVACWIGILEIPKKPFFYLNQKNHSSSVREMGSKISDPCRPSEDRLEILKFDWMIGKKGRNVKVGDRPFDYNGL
jgi:hypothetical protein